jgi:acyl-CoA thioesterase YciA
MGASMHMPGKQLIVSKLCKTLDLGVNGNLFGGRLLEWLDEAGAIFAYKQVRGYVVTVKVSEVLFKVPVHERDIIDIMGAVKDVGNSSITIEMDAINVRNSTLVCSCEIKYVHVNSKNEASPIADDTRVMIKGKYGID